ncbi:DNA-binding transcriptional regulator AraC [Paenibacillus sp. J2TS4]|nr:DNA-binding transcriptional regulator AraC [Paenibacillus sp. J2TS4]
MEMAEFLNYPAVETASPLPGILVSDHYSEADDYRVHRPRGTKDWLITYTLSGTGTYWIGEQQWRCHSGDIVVLKPGTIHHYATDKGSVWNFYWAHFVPQPSWINWLTWPEPHPGLLAVRMDDSAILERLQTAFRRLMRDSLDNRPYSRQLALNAMEEIILWIAQKNRGAAGHVLDPRVEEVLGVIAQDLKQPLSVAELAHQVQLSPSRMAHLFKEQVGDSIVATRMKIRLRQAARLLEFTSRTVTEIADDVGFQSPYYFTKQFTSHYGQSPTAYRKQFR